MNVSDCNREVNSKEDLSLLPIDFCMPKGYSVTNIYNADINNDSKNDRIIKYYNKNWQCADTIFLAIYFGVNDSTYKYVKTFSNLYTPMVKQSFKDVEWLVNNCSDEYMHRWAWDNQSWIHFDNGQIIVAFAVNLWNGFDYYFEYDQKKENWYLKRQQKWNIPDSEFERKYEPNSKIESIENGLCIDDFRIKNYLIPW